MRVLVVEDDPDQVIVRCMVLSHHGFETRRAGDADGALRSVRETLPDVIILDLGLPTEQDGFRLIRELRTAHPDVSLIVLTGSNIGRLRGYPELEGIEDLLEKGSSCKVLLGALERIAAARAS